MQKKLNVPDPAHPVANSAGFLPGSFDLLFTEHWPQVYRVLLRLIGDPFEAEDLALETFYRLYQHNPGKGRTEFNPGGWLYRVAINLGLHSIRSYQRRERYELAAGKGALENLPENRPAEIMANDEERRAVRATLARLPKRQSELLVLRHSGASYKEISATLGIPLASIGPTLLRAEREFEKRHRAQLREEV